MARSKSIASDPFVAALRLLTRCDRSEAELCEKLARLGFSASAIDQTLARCRGFNYLDDRRYALERARTMLRNRRGVGRKILLELRRRGIAEEIAEQALATASEEFDADQLLRELLERRFPDFDFAGASERERRRVIGFLQRRGFLLEQIFRAFKDQEE